VGPINCGAQNKTVGPSRRDVVTFWFWSFLNARDYCGGIFPPSIKLTTVAEIPPPINWTIGGILINSDKLQLSTGLYYFLFCQLVSSVLGQYSSLNLVKFLTDCIKLLYIVCVYHGETSLSINIACLTTLHFIKMISTDCDSCED